MAIKAVKRELLTQDKTGDYVRRFQKEARAAGGLSHPNIVTIYDVGPDYFVMEYLEGTSLFEYLARRGRLPLSEAVSIISPLVDALEYAHRQGVYHRDIKPANIMILPDGIPKLMDFSLAHLESTVMTDSGQLLGSPSYMSPEQIKGEPITCQADYFSVAVVAYEMLTGNKPFPGDNITTVVYRIVNEEPTLPRTWNPDLPAQVDAIFLRALAKKPGERFRNLTEFLTALSLKESDSIELPTIEGGAPVKDSAGLAETVRESVAEAIDETVDLRQVPPRPVHPAQSVTERKLHRRGKRAGKRPALAVRGLIVAMVVFWPTSQAPPLELGLTVETDPPSAEVRLDGREVGRSPIALADLAPGEHVFHITLEGYEPVERRIEIGEREPLAHLSFRMESTRGILSLLSDPAGAAVIIDGQVVGRSPIEGHFLEPGVHEIRVEEPGHQPWAIEVRAGAGERLDLNARLSLGSAPAAVVASALTVRPAEQSGMSGPAPTGPDVLEMGPGLTPPRRIAGEFPGYPSRAWRQGHQGTVVVQATITENGTPLDLTVVESAGPILDKAFLQAVRSWKYEPARRDGVPVRVRMMVGQSFRLGSKS